MKRLLAILLFIPGGVFIASSQSRPTYAEVYNFNVGDIFETQMGNTLNISPPSYSLTIVLAKWYSSHSDTVFYKDSMTGYTPPSCMHCTATFGTGVDTVFYTHLNSIVPQDTEPNDCPPVWDSIYVDSVLTCWQKEWEQGPSKFCLDTLPIITDVYNITYSWLIKGCGGPYYTIQFAGDYSGADYYTLIYAKKHDTVCGTEYVITGLNPIKTIAAEVKIYPNPSDGKFIFSCYSSNITGALPTITIYNILDEKVLTEPLQTVNGNTPLDLYSQPNGMYFYRVITESGELIGSGKLLIQK
jgi:hypothetical protein